MIAVFILWTLCFYIFEIGDVRGRIFNNTISPPSSVFMKFTPVVKSKTCLLKPSVGPCRANINMYYYDPNNRNCSTFKWGGCQGNGNRFDTETQCKDACLTKPGEKKASPHFCSLRFDYGFCFGVVKRYYYDSLWKVCKTTIYSGCGGNKNNFYNLEQCERICRFGMDPKTTKKSYKGLEKKYLIINPIPTTETIVTGATNTTGSIIGANPFQSVIAI